MDGVGAIIIAEWVEYLDVDGKLVTESLRDFNKKALRQRYASLNAFLRRWNGEARKKAVLDKLEAEGLPLEPIAEEVGRNWTSLRR